MHMEGERYIVIIRNQISIYLILSVVKSVDAFSLPQWMPSVAILPKQGDVENRQAHSIANHHSLVAVGKRQGEGAGPFPGCFGL